MVSNEATSLLIEVLNGKLFNLNARNYLTNIENLLLKYIKSIKGNLSMCLKPKIIIKKNL